MANTNDDLSGAWHCRYWFANTKHDGREDTSEHDVIIERSGDSYAFHSIPDRGEAPGSQMEGRIYVQNGVFVCRATETTSPTGEWNGMSYRFSFHLLPDGEDKLTGLWVAAIYNNGHPKIDSNRWEFVRIAG